MRAAILEWTFFSQIHRVVFCADILSARPRLVAPWRQNNNRFGKSFKTLYNRKFEGLNRWSVYCSFAESLSWRFVWESLVLRRVIHCEMEFKGPKTYKPSSLGQPSPSRNDILKYELGFESGLYFFYLSSYGLQRKPMILETLLIWNNTRRQCRNTNQSIEMLVYCPNLEYKL